MKLCLLRSGSSGNCTFIEQGKTKILLDAGGHSQVGLRAVLSEIGAEISHVSAVVVSHLHSDHINLSTLSLLCKNKIPLWVHTENTPILRRNLKKKQCGAITIHAFDAAPFFIGDVEFYPFLVDHDAQKNTSGFKFRAAAPEGPWVSFATDLGCFPDTLLGHFIDSEVIILEANHDTDLLWKNPLRPYFHKQRVASDSGHLSNDQAAGALVKICSASKRHPSRVILCHLSKDHNSPDMAIKHIEKQLNACGFKGSIACAMRDRRSEFIEVC